MWIPFTAVYENAFSYLFSSLRGFIESYVDKGRAHYWSSSLGSNDQDFRSEVRGTQLPAWVKFYSGEHSPKPVACNLLFFFFIRKVTLILFWPEINAMLSI